MKKTLSICLVLMVAMTSVAFAKPADEGNSLEKFYYVDGTTSLRSTIQGGVFGAAQQGTTYFGGTVWDGTDSRWEAQIGGTWTFDSGVATDFNHHPNNASCAGTNSDINPFKDCGLHALMEGWVGFDQTFSPLPYFRRLSVNPGDNPNGYSWASGATCVGTPAGLGGDWSAWCGVFPAEALALCYAAGQGYGNSWFLCWEYYGNDSTGFAYDGNGGDVNLGYDLNYEVEPGFDYMIVYVDTTGNDDDVQIVSYTDVGTVSNGSHTLSPGVDMRSTAGPYTVKFCGFSDGAYSDEDGFYPTTCGAGAVDDISVTGGGENHSTGFETGNDGWYQSPFSIGQGGEWSDIVDLGDLPETLTNCVCRLSGNVLVFEDLDQEGHGLFQDNLAASPWIDLEEAGLQGSPGKVIQFDGYFELPLLNYIFVQTNVQWYPDVCPQTGLEIMSPWTSDGFIRYYGGVPFCYSGNLIPARVPFSAVVAVGASQMRMALGVLSYCRFFENCTGVSNSTPWFDNVTLFVFGNPDAPILATSTVDQPMDAFPQDGSLNATSPGRLDCNNVKGEASPEPFSALGDTLIVNGAEANGADGCIVEVVFAVDPGPGIDVGRFNTWLTSHATAGTDNRGEGQQWYSARMDTAQQGDTVVPGTWMTAYHELDPNFSGSDTDLDVGNVEDTNDPLGNPRLLNDIFPDNLFTPGTHVSLYYRTAYESTPTTYFELPGVNNGNYTFALNEGSPGYLEWECLPSSMTIVDDTTSTWNCVLYVDHFDGRGAQVNAAGVGIEPAMANILTGTSDNYEGTPWDRYDVEAPSSQQASLGRPNNTQYGADISQILAYQALVWNSGGLSAFCLVKEDGDILLPWIEVLDGTYQKFYNSGDGAAESIVRERETEESAFVFMTQKCGVTLPSSDYYTYRVYAGDDTACVDLVECAEGGPVADEGSRTDGPHVGQGNGCPFERSFDVLQIFDGDGIEACDERYRVAAADPTPPNQTNEFASIATAQDDDQLGATYRTVWDGVSVHYRRDADCNGTNAIQDRLDEALTWLGFTGVVDPCEDPAKSVAVPNDPRQPAFKTGLANFAPNPLLGGAKGTIQFTLANEGRAVVDVFDVNGRLVKTVFDGPAEQGVNVAHWNGTDKTGRRVASGVYFYSLRAGDQNFAKKMVVVNQGGF